MAWRPEGWKIGDWREDESFLRDPPVIVEERLYNAYEAGADAMLAAIKKTMKDPHQWLEFWKFLDKEE